MQTASPATAQHEVIGFLSRPAAYGLAGETVERIDTHISIVWLAGEHAYKLKRAVRFDYVDFSTVELRRLACEEEVRLNRRTAPSLYVGVVPVTREPDGGLALGGMGAAVDWLVEMVRFDQDTLFDRLAERGRLDLGLTTGLADAIAALHASAEPRADRGGCDGMAWVIDGNALGFADLGKGALDSAECARLIAESRAELRRRSALLDARRCDGWVRRCHGDLHLRNICVVDGTPTLFDAVEFNEEISCIDVMYDLAFMIMDLWRRDLRLHANVLLNEYLSRTADLGGLPLLPLFLSCRAAVRAKTTISAARLQPDAARQRELTSASREYLSLARALLSPSAPCLIAVGGFSGSGKSTLARGVAPLAGPAPGALILRSDVIRKRLLGVSRSERLDARAYAAPMKRRVYETMATRAATALRAGHAVVADAVYASVSERARIEAEARAAGVPFVGLWIDGPPAVLAARLGQRHGDVSDATPEILRRQLRQDPGPIAWHRLDGSLDAGGVRDAAVAVVARATGECLRGAR